MTFSCNKIFLDYVNITIMHSIQVSLHILKENDLDFQVFSVIYTLTFNRLKHIYKDFCKTNSSMKSTNNKVSNIMIKPGFGVYDHVILEPVCSATKTS